MAEDGNVSVPHEKLPQSFDEIRCETRVSTPMIRESGLERLLLWHVRTCDTRPKAHPLQLMLGMVASAVELLDEKVDVDDVL